MRRAAVLAVAATILLLATVAIAASRPASGEDTTGDRVGGLETRVAALEATVGALVAGPTAAGAAAPAGERYTLTGSLTLTTPDVTWAKGTACRGKNGFDDIQPGGGITVRDESDRVVGASKLSAGTALDGWNCRFSFTIAGLPRAAFYTITVGHRTTPAYSFDDLSGQNWRLDLHIGG